MHRKAAGLQANILLVWQLAEVMKNVTKRAEAFLSSSDPE